MRPNRVKQLLKKGEPTIGSWCGLADPYANEVFFQVGFDWIVIDTEHHPIGVESLRNILVTVDGCDTVPIVRVNNNRSDYIKQALDMGAEGIMVPQVQTKKEAELAVEHSKYPPMGKRAFGPIRAANYGLDPDYINQANQELLLIVQIESAEAVKNTAAIAAVDGIDALFVGPYDLASSMGHLGNPDAPAVKKAIDKVIETANEVGCPWGAYTTSLEDYLKYVKRGATMATVRGDIALLNQAATKSFTDTYAQLEKMKLRPPLEKLE